MILKRRNTILICLAAAAFLTSCMGIDTKVKIARDGSGKVEAEYRLSEELVAFGELEANKAMLPVPLTREDVENSLRSAEGLRLDSWSSRKDGTDLLIKTVISFDNLEALVYYLDPKGELALHTNESGMERISFTVGEQLPRFDPDMKSIVEQAFAPYSFSFMVELPSTAKEATSGHPAVTLRQQGAKVYFEGKMKDIVTSEVPPSMGLAW